MVTGLMAVPPDHADEIGKIVFRVLDPEGQVLNDYEGRIETLQPEGRFLLAIAQWPTDDAPPGAPQDPSGARAPHRKKVSDLYTRRTRARKGGTPLTSAASRRAGRTRPARHSGSLSAQSSMLRISQR